MKVIETTRMRDLIETAQQAAEQAKDANFIRVSSKEDKSAVILTTVIAGKPLAWITYDAPQLDELISLLEQHRCGLRFTEGK